MQQSSFEGFLYWSKGNGNGGGGVAAGGGEHSWPLGTGMAGESERESDRVEKKGGGQGHLLEGN